MFALIKKKDFIQYRFYFHFNELFVELKKSSKLFVFCKHCENWMNVSIICVFLH